MDEPQKPGAMLDQLLNDVRQARKAVSIYLANGFQLKGQIIAFDGESILFKHKEVHQLVMRSAVATIYPLPVSRDKGREWWHTYVQDQADAAADGAAPA